MTFTSFQFLKDFQCLAEECPDSCCTGKQNIHITAKEYQSFNSQLSNEFTSEHIERSDSEGYHFRLTGEEKCTLFTQEQLCQLQGQHGHNALPNTCALFPRILSINGNNIEMSASLACPEIARRVLNTADGDFQIELLAETLPRKDFSPYLVNNETSAYSTMLSPTREYLTTLLSRNNFQLNKCFFTAACFAKKISPYFHRDSTTIDETTLFEDFSAIQSIHSLKFLSEQFDESPTLLEQQTQMISTILGNNTIGKTSSIKKIIDRIYQGYKQQYKVTNSQDLSSAYQGMIALLSEKQIEEVDLYLERYAKHYVNREWYTNYKNLLHYLLMLSIHIATLRFLLISNLLLQPASQDKSLESEAITIVQAYAKGVEHNQPLINSIHQLLETHCSNPLPHILYLLKT